MSFTSVTKKELTQLESKACCKRAELSALVRMNGTVQLKQKHFMLDIMTENPSTARYMFSLLKELYQVQPEVLVRKKVRLKKNNVYLIRLTSRANEILSDLCIFHKGTWERVAGISPELLQEPCCKRAYLRGAFLAGGSVNNPDSASYHLEIVSTYHDHSEALCRLMNEYHLHAKVIERKKGYVVYIKEGDKIGEFLNIIGAHPSLLHFENVRIMKDMRNSVNRLVNCETANLNKTIQAAMRQIENIRLIDREIGLEQLPERLREVAETRLKYPEVNLTELGELLPGGKVSKSAINHRLRKLDEMAKQLRRSL
ncbi:DNA-binding protein WhiA [Paenactinomyces guangxiensis]|uniref:Probable cell division protein WhiA n=1 Tax=Paenactinomyces guangxiensis TaxID=1490290 RepID=A0A7W1WUA0_9BACL|nr:DNA-binding protein WhiA [Paenactinomyces guangxiensis]MBA4496200.1 DNA-binding protein WhiA [Paenactinomyces guangxiensis]MBH8593289.1 DNA-binding protein WhiA [Paenactinomyces guangxiensis]